MGDKSKGKGDTGSGSRRLQQTKEEIDMARRPKKLNCFSYDSKKVAGSNANKPDQSRLQLNVRVNDESETFVSVVTGISAAVAGGIVATIIVVIILAVIGAVIAMATRKKRAEEANR